MRIKKHALIAICLTLAVIPLHVRAQSAATQKQRIAMPTPTFGAVTRAGAFTESIIDAAADADNKHNDGSGQRYTVQWFRAGRLEYHPELQGTRYVIEIGLAGVQALRQRGW